MCEYWEGRRLHINRHCCQTEKHYRPVTTIQRVRNGKLRNIHFYRKRARGNETGSKHNGGCYDTRPYGTYRSFQAEDQKRMHSSGPGRDPLHVHHDGVWPWHCCTSGHRKWCFWRVFQHKCRFWAECGYGCACWWKSVRSSYECSCFIHNVRVWPFALEDVPTVCFCPVSGFLPCCWDHFFTICNKEKNKFKYYTRTGPRFTYHNNFISDLYTGKKLFNSSVVSSYLQGRQWLVVGTFGGPLYWWSDWGFNLRSICRATPPCSYED
uniref:Aquaporin 7-2 n=1 Tax=Cyprinus carpio TaxID=7962 RepID=A0A1B4ZD88_CYPCA|nr:aquaporin 7-2 [Cyprinus carpio]